ncbi:GNAT family N-acetyltransferase [Pediococcus inopinatus]|uniref:GNAT family N-acetyltransferase n=1 Tax=Pediococcus inopinatus TaxID=114090 RepID=A0ABZ0Q3C9_9LACO|nr:GNAT family N-acetyltransferase [Pediococcus inopinatus]WPC21490.1 GNAT family N-acetyltransferase [Pediococcus inopinatus]WPP09568.1 GNAT family N-acetyltransferase [Pediococcus inopinatus]
MNEIVKLNEKDLDEFYHLYLYAFNNQDSEERRAFFDDRYNHSQVYGIRHRDKLSSGMLSIPLQVNFHGVTYKMNGIGDVMSYPEFGGHGAITDLMRQAFSDMRDDGVSLSYLAPFSYDFYRRFGYEEVFDRAVYQIKNTDLPRVKLSEERGTFLRLSLSEAISLIDEVYENNEQSRNGGLKREPWWWQYLSLKHPQWQVGVYLENDKSASGYVIYEAAGDTFKIQELMYTNQLSYQYLQRFICQHESMFAKFEYADGDPKGYPDVMADPYTVDVHIRPYMMARIIDLQKFVNDYPFIQKVKTVRLAVKDDLIPQNNGIWRLKVNVNGTSFEKLSDNEQNMADIHLDIQNLTKAFMGYRRLGHLKRVGAINGNFDSIHNLEGALTAESPMLWDYF